MTLHIKLSHAVAALTAGTVLLGGGYALASSTQSTIHACVSDRTHAVLQESRCGEGYHTLTWNAAGPRGERGARGTTGASGVRGTTGVKGATGARGTIGATGPQGAQGPQGAPGTTGNTGPSGQGLTAWAQVWMGSSTDEIAPGSESHNMSDVGSGGTGAAYIDVNGCSTEGLSEPVIQVTADDDPNDNLSGSDTPAGAAVAWVGYWSKVPDFNTLSVQIETANLASHAPANADFSITVTC